MHIIQEEIGIPKMTVRGTGTGAGTSSAVFTISPLPSGFGNTLGNALRRVLLSSLPGAAITAVKVAGATHEYTTLPGVKDSVLDLILNLKKIRFKKHSSETEIISLHKKGDGPVLAGDIKTSSDIEILNPDHVLTVLDGKNATLSLDMQIRKGVGYSPVQGRADKEDYADFILVDAAFSPVLHVSYAVSPTRVGERTDLDKLELEIKTNNSIAPEDAVKFAAELLHRYFDIFKAGSEEMVETDFLSDFSKTATATEEIAETSSKESYTPIEILNLSPRTLNALINGDIGSIEELTQCSLAKLSTLRGFGKKAQEEVIDALKRRGLALAED